MQCKKCGTAIPNWVVIDGKARNTANRKYCLTCSPFGLHNTRKLHLPPKKRRASDKAHERQARLRTERKSQLIALKGGQCGICGYSKCEDSLIFHHIDPSKKLIQLSKRQLANHSWNQILDEASKTVLLCHNCHAEVHSGMHKDKEEAWLKAA